MKKGTFNTMNNLKTGKSYW